MGPTTGRLVANLRAAGYQPEQVDEVYITHMHGDHVSGLVDGDKPVFPNAVVRADRRETGFWLSKEVAARAPADARPYFDNAVASLNAYVAAGKLKPFDGETELVPGIKAIPAHGHTPGHTIYVVESQGQKLAVLGDLMHVAAVQLPDPAVTISFDLDPKAAAPARRRVLADAAKAGYAVALAHFPFPGIGRLRAEGKGYVWVPANYSSRP
jgi:glyoxylase-like metal-dependent hydrolase (beta-lactamase superfamily II)